MLEADEVDVDYFTPAESTSLASIFARGSQTDEAKDTTTLKYVPPPPPSAKTDEVKTTKWIFTCVVHAFEWSNSSYINRGKLGLAILEVIKSNSHSILLYDSNKATVSFATISPKLKIHVRDDLNITYYDNLQKCWNIQTSNDDMNNMLQVLKNLEVTIVSKSEVEQETKPDDNEVHERDSTALKDEEKEVDTDSYMNQKTKDSILKRMANMGQSVLPMHGIKKGQISDSSTSDDVDSNTKNFRHKTSKSISRKNKSLSSQEPEGNIASLLEKNISKSNVDGQVSSSTKCNFNDGSLDMNIFISEQKMSNSELRINVSKMSDKIDFILERITDITNIDKNYSLSSFQSEIVQKLMREYESKIKTYENILSSKGIDCHSIKSSDNTNMKLHSSESHTDIAKFDNRIKELEELCVDKENIIATMKDEIKILNEKNNEVIQNKNKDMEALLQKMQLVYDEIKIKNEEILSYKKKLETKSTHNLSPSDMSSQVKKIMNDAFQAISANFKDEDTYTGDLIKTRIATVIKKTTIEGLKDL